MEEDLILFRAREKTQYLTIYDHLARVDGKIVDLCLDTQNPHSELHDKVLMRVVKD